MPDQAQTERKESDDIAQNQTATPETATKSADVEEIKAEQRSHFFAVANSLLGALHPTSPHLWTENLSRREWEGVRLIYEARVAQESEQGSGHISAIERMRYLNEGLLAVQGTLAMARSDSFPQARGHIEELRKRIARLKEEIAQAIVAEEQRKQQEKSKKELDQKKGEDEGKAVKKAEAQAGKA
ncbi:MAG TPA: hypothetical protein VEL05_10090 [Candidatus Acidoferrum sp.]|nr:hypothetical protein [Candidatus Acidoferrum sp.]